MCIIDAAMRVDVHFALEHHATSYAWRLPSTQKLWQTPAAQTALLDMCAHSTDPEPHKKPHTYCYFSSLGISGS